jgi:hypothetical protein
MTDLQSTNRVKLSKVREATFGVTPTSPVFKTIRETSSGLNANPKTVITNEIRSDRQVTDLILVGQDAGGDVGGELAFAVSDDDLEEALQGTWSNDPSIINTGARTIPISDVHDHSNRDDAARFGFRCWHDGLHRWVCDIGQQQLLARVFVDGDH